MSTVIAISDHNFQHEVEDYNSKPVLVLFHTPNGKPCQMFRAVFNRISETHSEHFKFVSINCDVYTENSKEIANNVFPSVAAFNKGKMISVQKGATDIAFFSSYVNRILSQQRREQALAKVNNNVK